MVDKTEHEILQSLKGKTIQGIKIRESWDTKSVNEVDITFTDGVKIHLAARTDSGCNECDGDGRNETMSRTTRSLSVLMVMELQFVLATCKDKRS